MCDVCFLDFPYAVSDVSDLPPVRQVHITYQASWIEEFANMKRKEWRGAIEGSYNAVDETGFVNVEAITNGQCWFKR
jgi:hypothetical protein